MEGKEHMETQICSGCQRPPYGGRVLIAMYHGFICGECVKRSIDQIEVARQRDGVLEQVRGRMTHLLQLVEPTRTRWFTRSEVRELEVLVQQLDDLTSAYVCSRGPFAVEVDSADSDAGRGDRQPTAPTFDEGLDGAGSEAANPSSFLRLAPTHDEGLDGTGREVANPSSVLRLVEQSSEASKPAPEILLLAFVSQTLNAELLDWPTPNMVEFMERHEIDADDFKVGIQATLDEFHRRCAFLDPRPQLTLVRGPDVAQAVPPSEAGWAERFAAPHQVSVPAESRCWIERLEAWIKSADISPETLAKRVKRDRAAVVNLLRQTDRQTSLRRFLDLVRNAGACLCGVPDTTPTAVFRRLREIVSEQGLSITTLARRSGINRSHLSELFSRPDPNPCLRTVQRMVVALNCDTEMMLVASSPRQDFEGLSSAISPAQAIKELVQRLNESGQALDAAFNEMDRRLRTPFRG
jgi:transcriptional regulator with XRE-family HTH domain